jgi:G:T-mismatch repair DNA endonuclease (very short patch repair protein)
MIRKANRRRKASGFEKQVHALLKEESIPFVKEKTVGRCHADIAIGDKFLVECQGCHWHGHKCQGKPNRMQKAALAKDARRFWFFETLGFTVVQIWECELRKSPDKVRDKLRDLYKRCNR